MRPEDILDSLEYIDEEYIEEADRTRSPAGSDGASGKVTSFRRRPVPARKWGTLAASLAVLAIAAFVLTGVLRTRSGNMDALQSSKTAEVREEPAEQYEAENAMEAAAEADAEEEKAILYEAAEAPVAADKADEMEEMAPAVSESVRIRVTSDAGEIVFVLNDSPAAKSLAAQLPLSVDTEPYGGNEIVFQPAEPLDTENGTAGSGTAGYLGYYAPWNNVVLYYGDFDEYPELYILGEAVSGAENIKNIKGGITLERIEE